LFAESCPSFWLDGAQSESEHRVRFSFMGNAAGRESFWLSYSSADRRLVLHSERGTEERNVFLFDFLQAELQLRQIASPELPFDFNGGFVGYFGYELKADCGGQKLHQPPYPDACLIFPDRFLAFDHQENDIHLVCVGDGNRKIDAEAWFDDVEF